MRFLRIALAVAILSFVCSAIYISALMFQRQTALESVGLGNVTWTVAQAPSEFSRFEQRVSAFGMADGRTGAQEVRLRFDIVVNRLKTLRSRDAAGFVNSDPRVGRILDDLEQALEDVRPLLADLASPGTAARILDILEPIYPKLVRLSTDANVWNIARIAADRQDLYSLQWTFTLVAIGMIACGFTLTVLLLLQNDLLGRAQKVLQDKERTLAVQNARFDAALDAMSLGLCLLDEQNRLTVFNPRFLEIFGLDRDRVETGTPIAELIDPAVLSFDVTAPHPARGNSEKDDIAVLNDNTHRMPNGTVLLISRNPMAQGGWACTFEDVTERHLAQARMVHMAHHDALTGMPNRLLFWESTTRALANLKKDPRALAVLYLDLDRFKGVNDTLGHPVGDVLLRQVGERLQRAAPSPDIVARLGGDEFAVLHVSDGTSSDSASILAARLIAAVGNPYHIGGNEIAVSTTVGIAIAPDHGSDTDHLMQNADLALYNAKARGVGTYQVFSPQLEETARSRRLLEVDLRRAIKMQEFELHYQPLIALETGRIVSGEALMRWRHPTLGMISPGEFIPLAEETGVIDTLGEWALEQACRDASTWPEQICLAVNLSPVQFRKPGLVDVVSGALSAAGMDRHRLELEITESVLLYNNAANIETLRALRALGVTIALDDFGTGYSSLSYLQRFPFDKLKIDQSFVRGLEERPESVAIVQSIAALGRTLNMLTTAEGVETQAQLDIVTKAGCSQAQGHYFSRALPEPEFRAMILNQAWPSGE